MTGGLEVRTVEIRLPSGHLLPPLTETLAGGEIVAVTGGAGSGKSSVLVVLAGRAAPAAGEVLLDGTPIEPGTAGVLTQQHELVGGLTAVENVSVRVLGRDGRRAPRRSGSLVEPVEDLLAALALPRASWHNLVEQLSGGQQQRVALARSLVGSPPLLVLDEPTSELDAASADIVWAALERAASAGAVVVLATDDPALLGRVTRQLSLVRPTSQ
ncbi:ATP-binding cassette domain-containing protein [Frondihabitans peucedani]|uniref:ATP-binding cassette domain-containing protein n=1 Tax=Frondihabitans peucedani TaxID=598626 RepID=A0ABP8E1K0_9MICO